jgi:hypothetical protein
MIKRLVLIVGKFLEYSNRQTHVFEGVIKSKKCTGFKDLFHQPRYKACRPPPDTNQVSFFVR